MRLTPRAVFRCVEALKTRLVPFLINKIGVGVIFTQDQKGLLDILLMENEIDQQWEIQNPN